jgi:hypothetical protein
MRLGPSSGRVHRISAARFGRELVYLASDCELATWLYFFFQPDVRHLATQVDCEPGDTRRIAAECGISHPRDVQGRPWTISTDLVVTRDSAGSAKTEAINIKPNDFDITQERFQRLCEIERCYHFERGASWSLIRSRGLNTNWARNFFYLYPAADAFYRKGFSDKQLHVQTRVLRRLMRPNGAPTVRDMCRHVTQEEKLEPGAAVAAYRALLATRKVWTNMNVADLLSVSPFAVVTDRTVSCASV